MSLSGVTPRGVDSIFLISSADHGVTWKYIDTLINKDQSNALGAIKFDGSSLVEVADEKFLLATPTRNGRQHDGTSVFRFRDISSGELETENGKLRELNHIPLQTTFSLGQRGGGQSDYDEGNAPAGVVFPQFTLEERPTFFQIFQTGHGLND